MTTWLLKNNYAIVFKEIQIKLWGSVLELGLKHVVLLRPKEPEMITIVENVWEQMEKTQYVVKYILRSLTLLSWALCWSSRAATRDMQRSPI